MGNEAITVIQKGDGAILTDGKHVRTNSWTAAIKTLLRSSTPDVKNLVHFNR